MRPTVTMAVLCLLSSLGCAAAPQKAEIDPTKSFDKANGEVVTLPDGGKALRIKAHSGQYSWSSIAVGRSLQPGLHKAAFTLHATDKGAPKIALYAEVGGQQMAMGSPMACDAGSSKKATVSFYSPVAFDTIAIKKMDAAKIPSVAISAINITTTPMKGYLRLEAYNELMHLPAPWGLRSDKIAAQLAEGRKNLTTQFAKVQGMLGGVEKWMDVRAAATERLARADALLRVRRLMSADSHKSDAARVEAMCSQVRDAMAAADLPAAEKLLTAMDTELSQLRTKLRKVSGGGGADGAIILPEYGTDICTWLKSFRRMDSFTRKPWRETYEPTPWRIRPDAHSPLTLAVSPRGEDMTLESTWTTNTYRSKNQTVTFSVLTPMQVVDVKEGSFRLTLHPPKAIEDVKLKRSAANGWFALHYGKSAMLFVTNRKAKKLSWQGGKLVCDFGRPAAVGMVYLRDAKRAKLLSAVRFYRALLRRQPVQCVQIQTGRYVRQIFEYIHRKSDFNDAVPNIAPVPAMLSLSLQPGSKLRANLHAKVRTAPGGLQYARGRGFRYTTPKRKHVLSPGMNMWLVSRKEQYTKIRKQGCKSIRLVCGATMAFEPEDKAKAAIERNLQWIRETGGMVVGIDMHNKWVPLTNQKSFSDPKKIRQFIDRWKKIIAWCKPYEDVIAWYDLINEPHIFYEHGDVKPYATMMRKVVAELRPLTSKAFLVETVNMGNPLGMWFWEDLGDDNVIVGYHDYWPHMMTHQFCVDGGGAWWIPKTHYPSFAPDIAWTAPSWRVGSDRMYYWDRWKCDSISLPVIRAMITHNYTFDCGEYGMVGYAGAGARRSGALWLEHTLDRFGRLGINHNVWGVWGGFTWGHPAFEKPVLDCWRRVSPQAK